MNGLESAMKEVTTGTPQGSPVSPLLFVIYISGVFGVVEAETEGIRLSFVDDVSWVVKVANVTVVTTVLEKCAKITKQWARDNMLQFDISQMETIIFSQRKQ